MKKLLLMLSLAFCASFLIAQVQHGLVSMSQGSNHALTIPLKKTNKKDVEAAWTKYIKDYKGKTKKNKKTGEIFSDDAMLKTMGSNSFDVYARVTEKGADTELSVWFDLGGAYLNNTAHADRYPIAVAMLEKFGLSVSTAALEEEIAEQTTVVKKREQDLENLQKDQTNAEAEIVKYEKKIEEARKKIEESIAAQKTKEVEIKDEKAVLVKFETKLKSVQK